MFLPTRIRYWSRWQGSQDRLDPKAKLAGAELEVATATSRLNATSNATSKVGREASWEIGREARWEIGREASREAVWGGSREVDGASRVDKLDAHPSALCLIKRGIDVVGAGVGLGILMVLFLPIAIAIKLDSPGPIFYSQTRYGLQGKPFKIWKFRSMVKSADALKHRIENQAQGLIFKNDHDPRITRVGKVLRKTSLDEFPQFLNVLWGDMSLVGTRPPTVDEVARYSPHHWQRLAVKPGLTGQWQVSGRSDIKDFEQIVELDLEYQRRWSPRYDLMLVLRTVQVLLTRQGAC